jgi:hypothetical protein
MCFKGVKVQFLEGSSTCVYQFRHTLHVKFETYLHSMYVNLSSTPLIHLSARVSVNFCEELTKVAHYKNKK